MSANAARSNLAGRQQQLIDSLVRRSSSAGDFEQQQIQAAAQTLANKRARSVAKSWPDLIATLDSKFRSFFANYAQSNLLPTRGGGLADGRLFAKWLSARDQLPAACRLEILRFDLRYRIAGGKLRRRRGPFVRLLLLRGPLRIVFAVRLPWRRAFIRTIRGPGRLSH